MLRLTTLANVYQRRTLRVLYGNTQAYPYDAQLDPAFNRNVMFTPAGGSAQQAAIIPGLAAVKEAGEMVTLATTAWASGTAQYRPFGLFANYVGGNLSDIPSDFDRVGVWRGVNAVFELLAPAWDDTGLATAAGAETGAASTEVYLAPTDTTGQLKALAGADPGDIVNTTARLMTRLSANAIVIELLV